MDCQQNLCQRLCSWNCASKNEETLNTSNTPPCQTVLSAWAKGRELVVTGALPDCQLWGRGGDLSCCPLLGLSMRLEMEEAKELSPCWECSPTPGETKLQSSAFWFLNEAVKPSRFPGCCQQLWLGLSQLERRGFLWSCLKRCRHQGTPAGVVMRLNNSSLPWPRPCACISGAEPVSGCAGCCR